MRRTFSRRVAAWALTLVALGVGGMTLAGPAQAWNANYPVGTCFSTANGLNQCYLGYYANLTYNSGSAPGLQAGVCVYSITSAGNKRGGGANPCTASSSFISVCFASGPTPASQAVTYAYVTDKVLTGHVDDSSGHTGCV